MTVKKELLITPKTRVGELLDRYPQLEELLMEMSPAFRKLKNPVLRRTVGRIATLQQAAAVGSISVGKMVSTLRKELGQEVEPETFRETETVQDTGLGEGPPIWLVKKNVILTYDASELIDAGESPMKEILSQLEKIHGEKIMMLVTPFFPAPIIDLAEKKGYWHYSEKLSEDRCQTYFIVASGVSADME